MSDLVYVLDAAPITTRGNETWSSKVFRRHLPPLYFFQSLQGPQPLGLVTPVFDAAGTRSYDELQPYITADLSRHTALGNVHVIDEARRKVPTDPEQVERHVAFLNSLDFDLRELDTTQALVYQGDRITGFSVGDGKRVSCTIAYRKSGNTITLVDQCLSCIKFTQIKIKTIKKSNMTLNLLRICWNFSTRFINNMNITKCGVS